MKYQYILTILLLLLFLNTSCNLPFFYSPAFTEPSKIEIIGVWTPDGTTRDKYNLNNSAKLIFNADGSFKTKNMPHWWLGQSIIVLNEGMWNLSKKDCCWLIVLNFPGLAAEVSLLEHKFNAEPKYIIAVTLGDPDSGNSMIFVKQKFASAIIGK